MRTTGSRTIKEKDVEEIGGRTSRKGERTNQSH